MDIQQLVQTMGPRFQIVAEDGERGLADLNLPSGAKVLDVGTGSGNFAIYLASRGCQVLTGEPGRDTTRYAGQDWAANARKAGVAERIRFEHFDAGNMPFATETFDAVFFFGVLHHVAESDRPAALRQALRVTKQAGSVVIFEPREPMLQIVRNEDPDHPPAANPTLYLTDTKIRHRRIEGTMMDIYIFTK